MKALKFLLLFVNLFFSIYTSCSDYQVNINKLPKYKMKILFIIDKFPWYTKAIILNQAIDLIDRGHDVYIYAHRKRRSEEFDQEIYNYNFLDRMYYGSLPPDLDTYDIIVFQYGFLGKTFARLKQILGFKAKLVTFFRGAEVTGYQHTASHEYDVLFEEGDLFLPICEYFKYRLMLLKCDFKKIAVQFSPIQCLRFKYKDRVVGSKKKIHIVSVARLSEEKGLEYCIKAIARLVKKYPNIRYTIVGDGVERKSLYKEIKRHKLQEVVKLFGWATQENIAKILNTAHIFLLASIVPQKGSLEAIPNAIKEAMLMGLPVVSTYHGGIAELVKNGVNGFLVPERDIEAIENRLEYLINNPQIWPNMGKQGSEEVKKLFDYRKLGEKLENIFYNLLGV